MPITIDEQVAATTKPVPPQKVSFEEYLAWALAQEHPCEWMDGEIIPVAAASLRHQRVLSFLNFILKSFCLRHQTGQVVIAPYVMKLEAQRRGREPDLLFVSRERENLLLLTYLNGPADVAIEITSRESTGRDRGEKYVEYEAAGVREYWLIDPERQQADFYRLGDNGRYRSISPDTDGFFHSEIITGFRLRVEWLWELPDEFEVLRQLGEL